jgi:glutamate-1-semialdehyde 2,1-aminomutase
MKIRHIDHSRQLLRKAQEYIPGGLSSSVRSMAPPSPLFFRSGSGVNITDADGNTYIDYALGWGPLILGHSHPRVLQSVVEQLERIQLPGGQHEIESIVAQKICQMVPCAEQVAFNSTGSEAVQLAIRLARAFTGRQKLVKFEGHYHGWMDNVLLGCHPKLFATASRERLLGTDGQSRGVLSEMIVSPWNDIESLERIVRGNRSKIAAILMEPILCNSGCLKPKQGYLEAVRQLTKEAGILLIFDEIITGFRVSEGGAQELLGVTPDLATFGKAVANGFPLSCVAGRRDIMQLIESRRVMHAGTFNGNPIALSAANAVLDVLTQAGGDALKRVRQTGENLISGIEEAARQSGIPLVINGVGAVFHIAFTAEKKLRSYEDTLKSNILARDCFIESMLELGFYLLPDGRWYVSTAHTDGDVNATLKAVRKIFKQHGNGLSARN